MKKELDFNIISKLLVVSIIFIVLLILIQSVNNVGKVSVSEEDQQVTEMIQKALVQCYALEGSYPKEIKYLEKYGIQFDEDKYLYHYEPFGDYLPTVMLVRLDGKEEQPSEFGGIPFE